MSDKILIVDDDLDTLRLVGLMLQRQGYDISAASSGPQALEMIKTEKPDIILLDIMMPDMDGYEVIQRLRSDPTTENIPIIVFTAKSQVDDKVMGLEYGADAYLTKPTQPRELFAHVKAVLSRFKKAKAIVTSSLKRGYIIGIMSAKGGIGVSTLAINLGISLHQKAEEDVIVADFRPGQNSISVDMGFPRHKGFTKLLESKASDISPHKITAELVIHSSGIQLLLAPSNPLDAKYITAIDQFQTITRHLRFLADFVLIDLGNGLLPHTIKVVGDCDSIFVVVEPTPNNVKLTKSLIDDLLSIGIRENKIYMLMINRVRSSVQLNRVQVEEELGLKIYETITPAPELAYQAAVSNVPMIIQLPDSVTGQQFYQLADKVLQYIRK